MICQRACDSVGCDRDTAEVLQHQQPVRVLHVLNGHADVDKDLT